MITDGDEAAGGTTPRRRFAVRRSPIHGRGVFALRDIAAGERLIEYRGAVITWRAAQRQYEKTGVEGHTYFFDRGDGTVIDGGRHGNSARFINHSCSPNCEALNDDGRIVIYSSRRIRAGQELVFDYQLHLDSPTAEDAAAYACACGSRRCRKTMLAP